MSSRNKEFGNTAGVFLGRRLFGSRVRATVVDVVEGVKFGTKGRLLRRLLHSEVLVHEELPLLFLPVILVFH